MSRSGYSDDCENLVLWRQAVDQAYENDECGGGWVANKYREETPAERWTRMRKWVAEHLHAEVPR